MEGRLVYAGSENPLTYPPAEQHYENARVYFMPPRGETWFQPFCGDDAQPEAARKSHGKNATVLHGFIRLPTPKLEGYSMLIIGDLRHRFEDPYSDGDGGQAPGQPAEKKWVDQIIDGRSRAIDLSKKWARYGVVFIAGEQPTPEEMKQAALARQQFAAKLIAHAQLEYRKGVNGQPGGRAFYTEAELAWAEEFGIRLQDILSAGGQVPQQQQPIVEAKHVEEDPGASCPYCAEPIRPDALKCKHCSSWLIVAGEPTTDPQQVDKKGAKK